MNINKINNISFTRQKIAKCIIRDTNNKKTEATLYKYDPLNTKDSNEILNSPYTYSIKRAFCNKRHVKTANNFYVLVDNLTEDIASCAEFSRHCKINNKEISHYILLDEIECNKNYKDSTAPLIGAIADQAKKFHFEEILSAFRVDESVNLKKSSFKKTQNNVWKLPCEKFDASIKGARRKNKLEFVG